jgi:phosphoribosylformimino-5-aminoimidazole carboxamide ribotide isomerase
MALRFVADGATGLHLVDLDAARFGTVANRAAIATIVQAVDVPCQLGGGIRSRETIADYLDLGVHRLVVGTKALTHPEWLEEMSHAWPGKLLVAIDARNGRVTTNGWLQTSDTMATDLARTIAGIPAAGIVYTDISRDGMMAGPNLAAMEEMSRAVDIPLIASGGVTTARDISRLSRMGVAGCVIGKALYEGRLTLAEAMRAAAVPDPEPSSSG